MKKLADYWNGSVYLDDDGMEYESAESLIQAGILDLCACGDPEANLLYIMRGLELIAEKGPDLVRGDREWREWWAGHHSRLDAHFGSRGAEYFFYYWADTQRYTDHGGSVPGWLDEKGVELLSLLHEWRDQCKPDLS